MQFSAEIACQWMFELSQRPYRLRKNRLLLLFFIILKPQLINVLEQSRFLNPIHESIQTDSYYNIMPAKQKQLQQSSPVRSAFQKPPQPPSTSTRPLKRQQQGLQNILARSKSGTKAYQQPSIVHISFITESSCLALGQPPSENMFEAYKHSKPFKDSPRWIQPHQIKSSTLKRPLAIFFKMERTRQGTIVLHTSCDDGCSLEQVQIGLSKETDTLDMMMDMTYDSIIKHQRLQSCFPQEIMILVNFSLPNMIQILVSFIQSLYPSTMEARVEVLSAENEGCYAMDRQNMPYLQQRYILRVLYSNIGVYSSIVNDYLRIFLTQGIKCREELNKKMKPKFFEAYPASIFYTGQTAGLYSSRNYCIYQDDLKQQIFMGQLAVVVQQRGGEYNKVKSN